MKVILQEDVANLGKTGDVLEVAPGYGRNFLLPRKLAVLADERNSNKLDHQKREAAARQAKVLADLIKQAFPDGGTSPDGGMDAGVAARSKIATSLSSLSPSSSR